MPEILRKALLEAMERFDRELRPQVNYEENPKYRYFIENEGRRYPVKKIVSWATEKPLDMVRGGKSRKYVEEQGFTIVDLHPERDAVQRAFAAFRQDPYASFMVKLRRFRSEQIRHLLAEPEAITADVFSHEIWRIESATTLNGQKLQLAYMWDNLPDLQLIADLERALEDEILDLHGNYIWGSGSNTYAPKLKDQQQRDSNVREACTILRDTSLSPPEKAQRLESIYGFGPNISTGLVMVLHPTEFALFNVQSQQALQTLGNKITKPEEFQEAITEIKEEIDADDFLELDLFLDYRTENMS
jgi:hypothetical protein